MALLDSIQLSV